MVLSDFNNTLASESVSFVFLGKNLRMISNIWSSRKLHLIKYNCLATNICLINIYCLVDNICLISNDCLVANANDYDDLRNTNKTAIRIPKLRTHQYLFFP